MLFNVIVVLLMIAATTMLITVAFRSDPQKSQDHHEAQEDPHSHTPVAPHEPPLSQEDLAASINALQQRFCSAPATERNLAVKDNFSLAPSAVLDLEQLGIEHSHAIELIAQASSTIQTERHIAVYADNFSFWFTTDGATLLNAHEESATKSTTKPAYRRPHASISPRKAQKPARRPVPQNTKEFLLVLKEFGFIVENGKTHYKARHPQHPGRMCAFAKTPSCHRAIHNAISTIRHVFGIDLRAAEPDVRAQAA